jgi:phosphatidylserine/phosphatidylglycerophosphate/cardiolipin synthase-like enzyme
VRAALLLLLLVPPAAAEPRLDALLPHPAHGPAGEFVRLANDGPDAPLAGWSLRSGRASLDLEGTLPEHGTLTLARDAAAYRALTGAFPDAEARLPPLADDGGTLVLAGPAGEDAVTWEDAPPGMMLVRSADGWRQRHVGWTDLAPLSARAEAMPFTRDDALPAALAAIAGARSEVRVEVYELTSADLAAALHAALARAVRVRVLVEGAPVGGMPPGEAMRLSGLAADGAEVRTIGGSGEDRYSTVHAKFAVADGSTLLLGSENWGASGFPPDGQGNRGWGAVVRSADLARFFGAVWDADADTLRGDVRAWPAREEEALPPPPPGRLPDAAQANVTALVAPDDAFDAILALPASARSTLDIEFLQLPLAWSHGPSPLVEALRAAAERGVRVRVLLDGQDDANAATAANLTADATLRGLPLEARLAPFRVHNKGLLVDGQLALVSSVNGGEASMLRNREAALVVDGPAVGTYARAFDADWRDALPRQASALSPALAAPPAFALALLGVAWRRRRAR